MKKLMRGRKSRKQDAVVSEIVVAERRPSVSSENEKSILDVHEDDYDDEHPHSITTTTHDETESSTGHADVSDHGSVIAPPPPVSPMRAPEGFFTSVMATAGAYFMSPHGVESAPQAGEIEVPSNVTEIAPQNVVEFVRTELDIQEYDKADGIAQWQDTLEHQQNNQLAADAIKAELPVVSFSLFQELLRYCDFLTHLNKLKLTQSHDKAVDLLDKIKYDLLNKLVANFKEANIPTAHLTTNTDLDSALDGVNHMKTNYRICAVH